MRLTPRTTLLISLTSLFLLLAVPGAIRAFLDNGPYLFSRQFFADLLARFFGAGRLRFILQPAVASALGRRDGLKDKHQGLPPFLWALARPSAHRSGVDAGRSDFGGGRGGNSDHIGHGFA